MLENATRKTTKGYKENQKKSKRKSKENQNQIKRKGDLSMLDVRKCHEGKVEESGGSSVG